MKKIDGNVTISRPRGDGCNYISIEITDETSGDRILRANIPLEGFAEALTGLAYVDCALEYYPQKNIGKKREIKHVIIPFEISYDDSPKEKEARQLKALEPFEVDGWKGSLYDLNNHHNRCDAGYNVSFIRYVDV